MAPKEPNLEKLVGLGGFEPPTSRLSSARSNQLSYKPVFLAADLPQTPEAEVRSHMKQTRPVFIRWKEKRRRRVPHKGSD